MAPRAYPTTGSMTLPNASFDVADVADVVEVAEVAAAGALARAARSLTAGGPRHAVVLDPHPVPIATSATIESISG